MDIYKIEENTTNLDELLFVNSTILNEYNGINRSYLAILIVPIIFLVATGNILVITAVCLDQKLQSATNYFLTSLAVADLLVALTVMPPSLIMIINNYEWPLSEMFCGVWVMLDVLFSTSSILHLCMISLDRYLALARPFQHRGNGNKLAGIRLSGDSRSAMSKRVATRIFVVWAVSLGIALPLPILGAKNRDNIFYENMCAINVAEFQIYGSLAAFFLPLTIMFIMYTLTIRTLQKQARLVASIMVPMTKYSPLCSKGIRKIKTTENCDSPLVKPKSDHVVMNSQKRNDSPTMNDDDVTMSMFTPRNRSIRLRNETGSDCKICEERSVEKRQNKKFAPGFVRAFQRITKLGNNQQKNDENYLSDNNKQKRCKCKKQAEWKERKTNIFPRKFRTSGRRISTSFKNRAMASINNEQRASKVLGLIFVLFCVFWCPFFVTNVMSRLCTTCDQQLVGELMNWFVWIGYVSSGVNPCVYTMFSRQFRSTFKKLIQGQFREIKSRPFKRSYSSQHNNLSGASYRTLGGSIHGRKPSIHQTMTSQALNNDNRGHVVDQISDDWIENVKSATGIRTRKFNENCDVTVLKNQRWRLTWHATSHVSQKTATSPTRSEGCKRKRYYSADDVNTNKKVENRFISIISEDRELNDVVDDVTKRQSTSYDSSKDSLWSSEQSLNDRLDQVISRDNDVIDSDVTITNCVVFKNDDVTEPNFTPKINLKISGKMSSNSPPTNLITTGSSCYKKEAFSRTDSGMGASFEGNHSLIMT